MSDRKPSELIRVNDGELREMLIRAAETEEHDFFERFPYFYEINEQNCSAVFLDIRSLLDKCKRLSPDSYRKLHKGTPFYWLGTAAFLFRDFQTAIFFYDAAVSEDVERLPDPEIDTTPAQLFVLIREDSPHQAARDLVRALKRIIDGACDDYNIRPDRASGTPNLTLDDIRRKFLLPAIRKTEGATWRTLASTFISWFLEWDYRSDLLEIRSGRGTAEPFFVHLFKGCLLVESLLKANNVHKPTKNQLGPILKELYSDLGLASCPTIHATFNDVLSSVPRSDRSLFKAVECVGRTRNTLGHDLGWNINLELEQPKYDFLAKEISAVLLLIIERLFK